MSENSSCFGSVLSRIAFVVKSYIEAQNIELNSRMFTAAMRGSLLKSLLCVAHTLKSVNKGHSSFCFQRSVGALIREGHFP